MQSARIRLICLALAAVAPNGVEAQSLATTVQDELVTNTAVETYLRWLQIAGETEYYPWSLRTLSPREVRRVSPAEGEHPWRARIDWGKTAEGFSVLRPSTNLVYNSAFPFGENDGPLWAGRGLTAAVRGGLALRAGRLTVQWAPVLYVAQNASFELMDHTQTSDDEYLDGRQPTYIDLPQRFGAGAFASVNPGESAIRLDVGKMAIGLSTARQQWGPAEYLPLILGNNAGGFAHLFVGTSEQANIGIGRVQGRLFWGRLEQSRYSPVHGDSTARFATGLIVVFSPAYAPGLEIGGARFFHMPWTAEGLAVDDFTKTFEGFLKAGIPGKDIIPDENEPDRPFDPDNQLASIFFRWVFRESGLELYGELARDDHSWDPRDLALEPDHSFGFVVGLGKVWALDATRMLSARGEMLDTQGGMLDQVRPQAPFYIHGWTRQGHTHRGQLLAAGSGYGGAAARVEIDYHHRGGLVNTHWQRQLRQSSDAYYLGEPIDSRGIDTIHALGVEVLQFRGSWDLSAGLTAAYNFNRNFGGDQVNLQAQVGVRATL